MKNHQKIAHKILEAIKGTILVTAPLRNDRSLPQILKGDVQNSGDAEGDAPLYLIHKFMVITVYD